MDQKVFRDSRGEVLSKGDQIFFAYASDNSASAFKATIIGFTPKMIRIEYEKYSFPWVQTQGPINYHTRSIDYAAQPTITKTTTLVKNERAMIKI